MVFYSGHRVIPFSQQQRENRGPKLNGLRRAKCPNHNGDWSGFFSLFLWTQVPTVYTLSQIGTIKMEKRIQHV